MARPPTPSELAARLSTQRREIALPNDALVIRGGKLALGDLERSVLVAETKFGRPGLSVFAVDVADPVALVGYVPHDWLSFTTIQRLKDTGFEVEQTLEPPHHTVWLPESVDREYWLRAFRSSFDMPIRREQAVGYVVGSL